MLDELITDRQELAMIVEEKFNGDLYISATRQHNQHPFNDDDILVSYLLASDVQLPPDSSVLSISRSPIPADSDSNPDQQAVFAVRKYKPVALKVKPVLADLPSKFRIRREIKGDPLANMPVLQPDPAPFEPTGRYTWTRHDLVDKAHADDFLWPAERELMHHFMMLHQDGFAWNENERGHFREDFFPPIEIPTIPHTPWVQRNLPIPPGIFEEVCKII